MERIIIIEGLLSPAAVLVMCDKAAVCARCRAARNLGLDLVSGLFQYPASTPHISIHHPRGLSDEKLLRFLLTIYT